MKRHTWILSIVSIMWLSGMAYGAAAQGSANVGQVDLVNDWPCSTTPTEIQGLSVSLTTTGGPVLLMITVNVVLPEGSSGPPTVDLDPVVDAHAVSTDRLTSIANGQSVLTFSRVYPLFAGGHTFGASIQCPPAQTVVTRAWLTAYELPLIKK